MPPFKSHMAASFTRFTGRIAVGWPSSSLNETRMCSSSAKRKGLEVGGAIYIPAINYVPAESEQSCLRVIVWGERYSSLMSRVWRSGFFAEFAGDIPLEFTGDILRIILRSSLEIFFGYSSEFAGDILRIFFGVRWRYSSDILRSSLEIFFGCSYSLIAYSCTA